MSTDAYYTLIAIVIGALSSLITTFAGSWLSRERSNLENLKTQAELRKLNIEIALLDINRAPAAQTTVASLPQGWFLAGDDKTSYRVGLDRHVYFTGTASVFIEALRETYGFITVMQEFSPVDYLGKKVRLTGKVKSSEVSGWAALWMRVDQDSGKVTAFDNMANRPIIGTTDWSDYAIVLEVAANSEKLAFGIILNGLGKVWLNDVRFEVVDEKEPTTHSALTQDYPINLDF
jgi:hypothetical protein